MAMQVSTDFHQEVEAAGERSRLYNALGLAFQPPTPERLQAVLRSEDGLPNICRRLTKLNPLLSGLDAFNLWRAAGDESQWPCYEDLAGDYARLIGGPGRVIAPPYESVYRDSRGWVMGEWAVDVKRAYEDAGLALSDSFTELPDHIAAELSFMAYLCGQEKDAWEEGDVAAVQRSADRQAAFLKKHLSQWVSPFTERIVRNARTDVFRNVARLLRSFVELEMVESGE